MRAVALDAERLAQLGVFSDSEVRDIAAAAIAAIAEQLERIDDALARGDNGSAAEAAHTARNEAMVMGALELGDVFGRLEAAAREEDQSGAGAAAHEAGAAWPATRQAIMQLAGQPGSTGV